MKEPSPGSVILTGDPMCRVAWQRSYAASMDGWVQAFGTDQVIPWRMIERLRNIEIIYDTGFKCAACRGTSNG